MNLLYIFKIILISSLLFGYYCLFLCNKQFNHYNRFYLLGMVIMSVILPLLNFPVAGFAGLDPANAAIRLLGVSAGNWEEPVNILAAQPLFSRHITLQDLGYIVYAVGVLILLTTSVRSLIYICKTIRRYPYEQINDIRFFQTNEPGTPFSFFKQVFWNKRLDIQSSEGQQIFKHELYHVRQKHSFDVLCLEISTILFWFNPFFYLVKRELKAIHEFLADKFAVSGDNRYAYAELLVSQSIHNKQLHFTHPFFHNPIKRRIAMITKFHQNHNNYFSRIMIIPLLFILFCAFAIRINPKKITAIAGKTITVVIDAGHGGIDPGAQSQSGINEKDITLSIAKKIQQLAKNYNVEIVMTREKDELPGKGNSIEDALKYRSNLVVQSDADLFVSIHVMADAVNTSASGFDMYIPGNRSAVHQKSIQFGSILTAAIKKDYPIADELKQREKPAIWVLRSATVPSVLMECGYITNEKDLAFISEEQNQEKIARDILEGIVKFSRNNPSITK